MIVEQGIEAGEKLYLSIPEGADRFKVSGEDLIATVKERKRLREEEDRLQQNGRKRDSMPANMTPEQMRAYMQSLTPEQREAMRQMRGAGGTGAGQGRTGTAPSDTTVRQQVVIRNR